MSMTYEEWKDTQRRVTDKKEMDQIDQNDSGQYFKALIVFDGDGAWFGELQDGSYHCLVETTEEVSEDFDHMADFLWNAWSQYEAGLSE